MNHNKMPNHRNRYTKNVSFGTYEFHDVAVGDTITIYKNEDFSTVIAVVDVTKNMIDDVKHYDDYVLVSYR